MMFIERIFLSKQSFLLDSTSNQLDLLFILVLFYLHIVTVHEPTSLKCLTDAENEQDDPYREFCIDTSKVSLI